MNSSCEFATIEEAFGSKLLKSPEPPSLRGHVAEIHDKRVQAMDTSIQETHKVAQGYPGSPSCFGNANAGPERELERCPAGTSCSACARRHACGKHKSMMKIRNVKFMWKSLSKDQKTDIVRLVLHDILTSDITLLLAFAALVYLAIRR